MIDILGIKRVILLLVLVGINALLAAVVYLYLTPEVVKKERSYSSLSSEIGRISGDVQRMQIEFDQLEEQQASFKELEADGFFRNQSRRMAIDVFNEIQEKSNVSTAIASIQAGVIEDNEDAQKASYKVLKSPIQVKIESLDDVDVMNYLFLVDNYFPGHVSIEKIKLSRESDVSGTVLRGIASGANPPLVKAEVDMVWRTMIPESQVIGEDQP